MTTIEGWPYHGHPKSGRDLQSQWQRRDAQLKKADAKLRRAFHAWEKAREALTRIEKRLEKEDHNGR